MIRVITHQGREVKRYRQTRLAVVQKIMETFVGIRGGSEAAELPHRPQAASIHLRIDAARVGRDARIREIVFVVEIVKVFRRVQLINRYAGDGRFYWISDILSHFL